MRGKPGAYGNKKSMRSDKLGGAIRKDWPGGKKSQKKGEKKTEERKAIS